MRDQVLDNGPFTSAKAFDEGVAPYYAARTEPGRRHLSWISTINLLHFGAKLPGGRIFLAKHL